MQSHRAHTAALKTAEPTVQCRQPVSYRIGAVQRDDETGWDAFPAQPLHRILCLCRGLARIFEVPMPAEIVEFAGSVDRNSDTHLVRLEHANVFVVDECAVGLDGVIPELFQTP